MNDFFSEQRLKSVFKQYAFYLICGSIGLSCVSMILLDMAFFDSDLISKSALFIPLFCFFFLSWGAILFFYGLIKETNATVETIFDLDNTSPLTFISTLMLSPYFYLLADNFISREDVDPQTLTVEIFVQVLCVGLQGCLFGSVILIIASILDFKKEKRKKTPSKKEIHKEEVTNVMAKSTQTFKEPKWQELKKKAYHLLQKELTDQESSELEKVVRSTKEALTLYHTLYEPTKEQLEELELSLHYAHVFLDQLIQKYNDKTIRQLKKQQEKLKRISES